MLGVTARPTQVEQMIMPPTAHGVRAISSGMLKKGNEPLPLRGPILHRLLQQFLADVFWGDLDVLLMDLPPGTGDVAISAAHLVPGSELIVVTTPQLASSEVAERAGALAAQLHQRVVGVIENMSYLPCPHCGERVEVFGAGGGQAVADTLTRLTGAPVPLLGEIPIDTRLREAGDAGVPVVVAAPDSPAAHGTAEDRRAAGGAVAQPGRAPARPDAGLRPRRPAAGSGRPSAQVASSSQGGFSPEVRGPDGAAEAVPMPAAVAEAAGGAAAEAAATASAPVGTVMAPAVTGAAAAEVTLLTSSSRCLRTKYLGFRSLMSSSRNSSGRCCCRSARADSAIRRKSRRARPAWVAIFGS